MRSVTVALAVGFVLISLLAVGGFSAIGTTTRHLADRLTALESSDSQGLTLFTTISERLLEQQEEITQIAGVVASMTDTHSFKQMRPSFGDPEAPRLRIASHPDTREWRQIPETRFVWRLVEPEMATGDWILLDEAPCGVTR